MAGKSEARALRIVDEPVEKPPPTGDVSLTRMAIANWNAGQRRCRARGRHNWGPYAVYEHRQFYDVVEQCSHCRNRRHAPFAKTGRKLDRWTADYRGDYLLPKGAARVVDDLHDDLMLEDILSRRIVEVPNEEDDE